MSNHKYYTLYCKCERKRSKVIVLISLYIVHYCFRIRSEKVNSRDEAYIKSISVGFEMKL